MGNRITWRSRPRNGEYPWPLATSRLTAAEFAALGVNFIGPLSLPAVVELLYRVRKVRFEATATADSQEYVLDGIAQLENATDELLRFADTVTYINTLTTDPFAYTDGDSAFLTTLDDEAGQTTSTAEIIHVTDSDEYYLDGTIRISISGAALLMSNRFPAPSENVETFEATLVLASGTFSGIAMQADAISPVSGSALTISATAWFPFQDRDGLPQWCTETGRYIPDGTPRDAKQLAPLI